MSNYLTKSEKNAAGVDILQFVKSDFDKLHIVKLEKVASALSSLKSEIDKIDSDKLAPAPLFKWFST